MQSICNQSDRNELVCFVYIPCSVVPCICTKTIEIERLTNVQDTQFQQQQQKTKHIVGTNLRIQMTRLWSFSGDSQWWRCRAIFHCVQMRPRPIFFVRCRESFDTVNCIGSAESPCHITQQYQFIRALDVLAPTTNLRCACTYSVCHMHGDRCF